MGRKSISERRSAEILDAVEVCLVKYGLARTTLPRIAGEAGMATSIIRHYLGDKQAVIDAAMERCLEKIRRAFADAMDAAPAEERVSTGLDVMFAPGMAVPEINQIIDEFVATSYFDERMRTRLRELYREFRTGIRASLRVAHPKADSARIDVVAYGLMALAHSGATFAWLEIDRAGYRKLRTAADALVATLS